MEAERRDWGWEEEATFEVSIGRLVGISLEIILWPPDAKSWLIGKDPDAGRDWGQEEKGTTGWDGWMASPTGWAWVWVNSRSWSWIGRPGVLLFMGLQRVGHDRAPELNGGEGFLGKGNYVLGPESLEMGTQWKFCRGDSWNEPTGFSHLLAELWSLHWALRVTGGLAELWCGELPPWNRRWILTWTFSVLQYHLQW